MSLQATNWYVEEYKKGVTYYFQYMGFKLSGTVMPQARMNAAKAYFPIAGKGEARKKVRGQVAVPMNASRENKEALLETWEAFDEVYTLDLEQMSVEEKTVVQKTGAMALGRAVDQNIYDMFDATAPTAGGPQFVDGGADGFGLEYAMEMCGLLDDQDAPADGQTFCALPSKFWNQLLAYKQFSSSDYVGPDLPFTKMAKAKSWNGVHWFMGPKEWFSSSVPNKLDIFLWHKSGFGWANNKKVEAIWDWDNRKGCHTVRLESQGADCALLNEAVIRGRFDVTTPIVAN